MELTDPIRSTWKRRVGIGLVDVLALIITLPACFMVFVMGAFASDSGTHAALVTSLTLIGVAGLYALATLVLIILSQVRNSYKLAALPIIVPVIFYIWVYTA